MIDLICRRVCCMFAVAAWTASGYAAESEPYPNKAVRMIVPFPPGGTNDIFGRLVAQKFSESWGQPVVVDNRGGAGGILGTTLAAQAPPDGYTMLVAGIGFSVNPSLFKKLPYDTGKDLVPVTLIALTPLLLVVHPSLPVKSLQDLIGYAKSNPGKLNFGSGGSGSAPQLAGEMFKSMAGIQITHVPYKGGGPALADVMGGQIQMMIENVASTLPQVKAGKLKALAVSGLKRSALLPDMPTLDESGLKGYEIFAWNGLFVPAGTPKPIISKIHAETVKAIAQPDVKQRMAALGAEGVTSTPEEFAAYVRSEIKRWAKTVQEAGIKAE